MGRLQHFSIKPKNKWNLEYQFTTFRLIWDYFCEMPFKIKILSVGTGDAIQIQFKGIDEIVSNVLIDGGYVGSYKRTLKQLLLELKDEGQNIDLWCISHIDADHIGGVLAFFQDPDFSNIDFVKLWWFNHELPVNSATSLISVGQGRKVREYLVKNNKCPPFPITNQIPSLIIGGTKLTVLSPDVNGYNQMTKLWENESFNPLNPQKMIVAGQDDYSILIEDFLPESFIEDKAIPNGSSIAFLIENPEFKALFLADSHPSTIEASLRNMGYSEEKRCRIDFLKLSHHGSKHNTSLSLLSILDVHNFIISADGIGNDCLPNKECLVRILLMPSRDLSKTIRFYFNHDNQNLRAIFAVDIEPYKRYNFEMVFPVKDEPFLLIEK